MSSPLLRIFALIVKEFIQLMRDRPTMGMILGIPLMQLFVFGSAINFNPKNQLGGALLSRLEDSRSEIYAAGPSIQVLTKFGLFDLRYYEECGAKATPSGQQLMFSVTLAGNPFR